MKEIKLNKAEYDYLSKAPFVAEKLSNLLFISLRQIGDGYLLIITEEQADELRDLFGEQLQIAGFDKDYRPTYEGELLESLIDKFFCG